MKYEIGIQYSKKRGIQKNMAAHIEKKKSCKYGAIFRKKGDKNRKKLRNYNLGYKKIERKIENVKITNILVELIIIRLPDDSVVVRRRGPKRPPSVGCT